MKLESYNFIIFFIPKLHRDIIKASVPEFRPKQNFEPVNFVINFSNLELESDKTNFHLRTLSTELKISFFLLISFF